MTYPVTFRWAVMVSLAQSCGVCVRVRVLVDAGEVTAAPSSVFSLSLWSCFSRRMSALSCWCATEDSPLEKPEVQSARICFMMLCLLSSV
jgi:hypothetical protein